MHRFHALQSNFPQGFSRNLTNAKILIERPQPRIVKMLPREGMRREREREKLETKTNTTNTDIPSTHLKKKVLIELKPPVYTSLIENYAHPPRHNPFH